MNISDILSENQIFLDIKAGSKREFFQILADRASEITGVDSLSIFDSIIERENLGSTGFGDGTALPHGRFKGLDKVHAFFVRLSSPIDFDAIDNKPVDLVFLLMSPENKGADHLTALATISRILKNKNICDRLHLISDKTGIYTLLSEA